MAKYTPVVELMDIDKIHPYAKNAKIHSESQINSLVEVIKTQGWDVPIVVDRHGSIIKGHGRRLAALAMGMDKVPVIVRHDLTDAQVKAARLSDNRVAMGDFDVDSIRDELAALRTEGFDLSTTGFGDKELEMMLGELDKVDFDVFDQTNDAPVAPEAPQSVTSEQVDDETTDDAPKVKSVLVSDVLGFKHISSEYRADLIEFMALVEGASEAKGSDAFGLAIRNLVIGSSWAGA